MHSPCEAAAKASLQCMNRNDFARDKCTDYFQAYRDCKKAWVRFMLSESVPCQYHGLTWTSFIDRAAKRGSACWPTYNITASSLLVDHAWDSRNTHGKGTMRKQAGCRLLDLYFTGVLHPSEHVGRTHSVSDIIDALADPER